MEEILIAKFKLPMIEDLRIIEILVVTGYRKTGNKFSVQFNGSKGYLDNLEISCEGYQAASQNILSIPELRNKDRSFKSKMLNVFWSEENGIRISIGADKPRIIQTHLGCDDPTRP